MTKRRPWCTGFFAFENALAVTCIRLNGKERRMVIKHIVVHACTEMETKYDFPLVFPVIWIMLIYWAKGDQTFTFSEERLSYEVLLGSVIHLKCLRTNYSVNFLKDRTLLVDDSNIIAHPSKYKYTRYNREHIQGFSHTLTINGTDRSDSGTYFCRTDYTDIYQLVLEVRYIPRKGPICTTFCGKSCFLEVDNEDQDFQFNCTIIDGNPKVNFSLFLDNTLLTKNLTKTIITKEDDYQTTLSFSSFLLKSYKNSVFTCNVTQRVDKLNINYQDSCSYGPIIIASSTDGLETAFTTLITNTFTTDNSTFVTTTEEDFLQMFKLNILLSSLIGIILILSSLIYVSMKFFKVNCSITSNSNTNEHYFHGQLEDTTLPATQNRNDDSTNESNFPTNNEDIFKGMSMVDNVIYSSFDKGNLKNIVMIKNEIYESATDLTNHELDTEVYTTIKRS